MSYDYNSVGLIGRLTRDPETVTTQSGKSVAKFGLAVGTGKDSAAFIDCEAWEKTGEFVAKHFAKGDALAISGSLRQQDWEDKATGTKRSKLYVNVRDANFLPQNKPRDGAAPRQSGTDEPSTTFGNFADQDDDIPF
jgi:single-strand DNA-binding protein